MRGTSVGSLWFFAAHSCFAAWMALKFVMQALRWEIARAGRKLGPVIAAKNKNKSAEGIDAANDLRPNQIMRMVITRMMHPTTASARPGSSMNHSIVDLRHFCRTPQACASVLTFDSDEGVANVQGITAVEYHRLQRRAGQFDPRVIQNVRKAIAWMLEL
jgi:hypothetical protein